MSKRQKEEDLLAIIKIENSQNQGRRRKW